MNENTENRIPIALVFDGRTSDLARNWALCYAMSESRIDLKFVAVKDPGNADGIAVKVRNVLDKARQYTCPVVCLGSPVPRQAKRGTAITGDFDGVFGHFAETNKEKPSVIFFAEETLNSSAAMFGPQSAFSDKCEVFVLDGGKDKSVPLTEFTRSFLKGQSILSDILYDGMGEGDGRIGYVTELIPLLHLVFPSKIAPRELSGNGALKVTHFARTPNSRKLMGYAIDKICKFPLKTFNSNISINQFFERTNPWLTVYECGREKCAPLHSFGPMCRHWYILHFVRSGKGNYTVGGVTREVTEGQAFLIRPEEEVFYIADADDPWEYSWVSFAGVEADELLYLSGFSEKTYVREASFPDEVYDIIKQMLELKGATPADKYELLGRLYILFSRLFSVTAERHKYTAQTESDYVAEAINYINENISGSLKVSDVSAHVGLERTYLFRIFKSNVGVSVRDYILTEKLNWAVGLIKETGISLSDVAYGIGYKNYNSFSRIFKKKYGCTVTEYISRFISPVK